MPESAALSFSPLLERALLYVTVTVATLVAFTNWRRGDTRAFRELLIAFFALLFVEGALLAVAAQPGLLPASLVHGLDFAAIVLLAWAFLSSSLSPRAGGMVLVVGLTLTAAFSAFSISAARLSGGESIEIGIVWSIVSSVVAGSTAAMLVFRHSPDRTSGSIAAFVALALASMLDTLQLPDLAGVSRLIAFLLFPLGLYQRALGDLSAVHDTLREFSQSALRQTQEFVTLLEASAYLFTSFDLDELLRKVVQHAALGIDADRAIIALNDDVAPQTLQVGSSHPRGLVEAGLTFPLNSQPALALAVSGGEQVSLGPRRQGAASLARLLNAQRPGPMIIQPIATQGNTIGVFVAANMHDGREFSDGQKRLLEALGRQIAAAIENARLYRSLDTQARELARVLATREQEATWFASILESIGDGVIVADRADQIVLANAVMPRLLDTPMEYILRRPLGQIFERLKPIGNAPNLAAPGQAIGLDVVRAAFEYGKRTLHVSMTPVRNLVGERLGVVLVMRDISHERQREISRAQFIGSIAQEFRTPLTTIKGYADLLARGAAGALPSAALGFVETIRANAERLSVQVNTIQQFSELDRGRVELSVEEIDVASILADAADAHRPRLAARGLSLDLQVKPNLPSVRADRARVRQALDQLLDNALKFTSDGGQVRLSAMPSWDGQSIERPAYVAVSVTDSGVGFDAKESERIFEAFYRGDNPVQVDQAGLGIGLSIARGLCEAMGGQLWARGDKGSGSTFTLILPVARVTDARLADPAAGGASIESWIEQTLSFPDDGGEGAAA